MWLNRSIKYSEFIPNIFQRSIKPIEVSRSSDKYSRWDVYIIYFEHNHKVSEESSFYIETFQSKKDLIRYWNIIVEKGSKISLNKDLK